MRLASLVLLSLMLVFLCSGAVVGQKISCPRRPTAVCTLEYQPLCGSDGKTYSNRCFFCNAVVKSGGRLRLRKFGKC